MIETGLLWYDDDSRRPVAVKIAEAAQRYRERVGLEPTTCQLNPAQAPTPAAEQPRRKRKDAQAALSIGLRLVPPPTLRPKYFFVGLAGGEPAKRGRVWRPDGEEGRSAKCVPTVAATVVPASAAAHKKTVAAAQAPHTTTGARVAASKGEVGAAKKTVKRASQGEVARAHKASNTNGAAATLARPAAPATGVATPRTRATPAPAAAAPKKTSRAAAVAAPVPAPARARKAARTTPAAVASTGGRSAKAVVPS